MCNRISTGNLDGLGVAIFWSLDWSQTRRLQGLLRWCGRGGHEHLVGVGESSTGCNFDPETPVFWCFLQVNVLQLVSVIKKEKRFLWSTENLSLPHSNRHSSGHGDPGASAANIWNLPWQSSWFDSNCFFLTFRSTTLFVSPCSGQSALCSFATKLLIMLSTTGYYLMWCCLDLVWFTDLVAPLRMPCLWSETTCLRRCLLSM